MYKYLLSVEKYYSSLTSPTEGDIEDLKNHIHNFQHERLIHLIVTALFALITLYGIAMSFFKPNMAWAALSLICIVLEGAYIVHYFHLENGVQRLYHVYDELKNGMGI